MARFPRHFVLAATAIAGFGQIAYAADMPTKAPPLAPVAAPGWTGFYVGFNTGGSVGTGSASQTAAFSSPTAGANGLLNGTDRFSPYGWVAGGQLGYNWQVSPSWVVGLEADWQWTSEKAHVTNCTPPATVQFFGAGANGFGYCLDAEHKLTNFGTARARAGYLSSPWVLWYVTGGLAWGTVKNNLTYAGSANSTIFPAGLQPGPFFTTPVGFSTTKVGWTAGAGVETKLGGGWSAKLEYLFVNLGSVTDTMPIGINPAFGPAFNTGGAATATSTVRAMDNIVRVGLNYTLGQNATAQAAYAADMPTKAPAAAPVAAPGWTGFYVGLNAGGSIGTGSGSQSAAFSSPALGANGLVNSSDRFSPYGGVVGGQLGYNWQVSPSWVVGVEADWQWTSQKASALNCTPPAATLQFFGAGANGFGYCLDAEHKLTNVGTARARAGYLSNPSLLWYVTGGLAWGTVKDNLTFAGSANPTIFPAGLQPGPFLPGSVGFSTTKVGWTAGAGVETKLGGGWSAKLEYLFVNLGSVTDTMGITINPAFGPAFTTGGVATATSTVRAMDNIVRVGVNYQFH